MSVKPAIVSLFCGCGGFDLGFEQAGFRVALALDINKDAVQTYNLNRKVKVAEQCDLSKETPVELEKRLEKKGGLANLKGLIGGAPCQSFSQGNVFFDPMDIRHTLPKRFAEFLAYFNRTDALDFFVFENVEGINSKRHEGTFKGFKKLFEKAGFVLHEDLLDAADFGVPQRRPRIFVIGLNRTKFKNISFKFPAATCVKHKNVVDVLGKLPEPVFFSRGLTPDNIPHHRNHWTMQPKSPKFSNGFLKEGVKKGRSFRVLAWNKPSLTVAYGHREIHIHPSGKRRLSVHEAMLLQGLPDDYILTGTLSAQIKQVSDTVPRQVGEVLARSLLEATASGVGSVASLIAKAA